MAVVNSTKDFIGSWAAQNAMEIDMHLLLSELRLLQVPVQGSTLP